MFLKSRGGNRYDHRQQPRRRRRAPPQTEVLSTVVAQLEPIHATCMEEVNKNIDQIIQYMEIGARGFPGYDLFVSPEFGVQGMHPLERLKVVLTLDSPEVGRLKEACARLKVWGIFGVILKLEGHESPRQLRHHDQ